MIEGFLKGAAKGDLVGTYYRIKDTFKEFVDFTDPNTFDYLAAWVVGTYFFPVFNLFPYLHFTGTKEVGKSKTMRIMSQICFNGTLSVSITDASQFRMIAEMSPTLFMDESENLGDKTYSTRRAILLGGVEKGSTAQRVEKQGDTWFVREFENYSPRVFGSISNMDDTLISRTIVIEMMRSFDDRIKNAEAGLQDPLFDSLRDALFLVTMDYGKIIKQEYETLKKPAEVEFEAREWNLFKPIYTIGLATSRPEVLKALIDFANARYKDKVATYNETATENVILKVLLELVQEAKEYSLDEIHDRLKSYTSQLGHYVGTIHKDELGMLIKKLGVAEKKDRRQIGGQQQTIYLMNPSTIQLVAKNRRVV